jgi:hypothetical protein
LGLGVDGRNKVGSWNSSALTSLSSLTGGSVTLLDYWFQCVKPYLEGADVVLYPCGEWILEQPLEGRSDSG